MTFEDIVIKRTVNKLIKGQDYRAEVINSINTLFFDFALDFFKKIVNAKLNDKEINLNWYKKNFINNTDLTSDEIAIYAGTNKKTIHNIHSNAKRDVVIDVANANFENMTSMIKALEEDVDSGIDISLKISYKKIVVELNLAESLLVINALATKKIAIRGGAWSSIGKKVEKPLIDELCRLCNVPAENIDNKTFKKDKKLEFDREVDYKLISKDGKIYRTEVKLMGKGNPESADATIARNSDIFIADTLSGQNKKQLKSRKVLFLEMKNNNNCVEDFRAILNELGIPNV
jgi:hypothetical protein